MRKKITELIALGPELREKAQRRGAGLNEAYHLVHEILAPALQNADAPFDAAARDELAAQLERRLSERQFAVS